MIRPRGRDSAERSPPMLSQRLETLLTVAEKQNFTQAAQALSLTQPAVSHHIASLEEDLGAKLFVRGKSPFGPPRRVKSP